MAWIVKAAARTARLHPARFSRHSLRAGLVTEAAARASKGAGHHSPHGPRQQRIVRRYIREEGVFVDNPAERLL